MFGKPADQQSSVESLVDDLVKQHHDVAHLVIHGEVDDLEVILRVQHVQVLYHFLVRDIPLTERDCLVEDAQGVTHTAVRLLRNDGKSLVLILDALFLRYRFQMVDGVTYRHPLEVVNLTTAQDCRQDLVFLCGGEDEDDMRGRLFQRLQESVKGCRGEHMHLVDDKHLVFTHLWRYTGLFHQGLDMLHGVVGGSV